MEGCDRAVGGTDGAYPVPIGTRFIHQGDGDLGARLGRLAARGLTTHPSVLLVGADVADLTPERIADWLRIWGDASALLVPASDGGFVALGLRALPAGLFEGVPWGTSEAGRAMAANLSRAGLATAVGPLSTDVDTLADLLDCRLGRVGQLARDLQIGRRESDAGPSPRRAD